jgi:hypothetical protein
MFWRVGKRNLHGIYGVCAEQVNYGTTDFSNFTLPQKGGKNYASYLFLLSSLPSKLMSQNTHVHWIVMNRTKRVQKCKPTNQQSEASTLSYPDATPQIQKWKHLFYFHSSSRITYIMQIKRQGNRALNTLTSSSYHMSAGGVFQFCHCSTILLQHLRHVLPFIVWETTETHSCTMEWLQLVTHLCNRNKLITLQVRLDYSMLVTQQLPYLPIYHAPSSPN